MSDELDAEIFRLNGLAIDLIETAVQTPRLLADDVEALLMSEEVPPGRLVLAVLHQAAVLAKAVGELIGGPEKAIAALRQGHEQVKENRADDGPDLWGQELFDS